MKNPVLCYLQASKQINPTGLKSINVAFLSTYTMDLLSPYLVVEAASRGLYINPYFGPFNQLEQQVLDSESDLYKLQPDVIIIAIDREFNVEERLQGLLGGIRRSTKATVVVFNQTLVANENISRTCEHFTNTYIFDYEKIVFNFGYNHWYDPKLWYLGGIPFGAEAQLELGRQIARYLHALYFPPCKCLVVDLDNTLWGGVLGEGDVQLGGGYPGNVYQDFQRRLLSLKDRGTLLAIASKNNESEVLEFFQNNQDCILKLEDFVAFQINWQDKATSLVNIAKEINIGTDALAFFDDSPVEREWVHSQLPEVTIIEVPKSPSYYIRALEESEAFDQVGVTEEDQKHTQFYQEEQARKQLQTSTVEEFLQQLEMEVTIGHIDSKTMPRVVQLIGKTNQFNLTTYRYTQSDVQEILDCGAVGLWMRVKDRFGDLGLVGVAIAIPIVDTWKVLTFLLSCRAIGRRLETELLNTLICEIREQGGKCILGEYIPTPKNVPVSTFYRDHGFEKGSDDLWKLVVGA